MLLNQPWLMRPTTWPKELSSSLWLRGDGTSHTDGAANCVRASNQNFSVASNSTLQTGNVDWWCSIWVKATTLPNFISPIGKWDSGNSGDWSLQFTSGGKPSVSTFNGTTFKGANWGSAISTGVWTHLFGWFDSVAQTISISVDTGTPVSTSTAGFTPVVSTGTLRISGLGTSVSDYWDGQLDSAIFGKSPVGGITALATTIRDALYNSGNGLSSKDITSTQITTWGVVSGWDFDSTTNLTKDYVGTNTLTNNNAITCVAGKVTANILADGDTVTTWDDGSANANNATQATFASRPIYKTAIQNNRSIIRFDGIDDSVTTISALMSMSYLTNCTVFMAIIPNASQTNNTNNIFVSSSSVVSGNFQLNAYLGLGTPQLVSNLYPDKWCSGFSRDQNSTQENHTSVAFGSTAKIYSLIMTGGVLTNYLNGTQDGQATANGTMQGATTNNQTWRIGVGAMKGDIAEFMVWNAVLSSVVKSQVETYLNWKYRIY